MSPAARRALVLLAALLGVALTARLGLWQLSRADQKEQLQALLDARGRDSVLPGAELARTAEAAAAQHYRRVRLRGEWLAAQTVFLDNRQMHGRPGFFVVTPLRLDALSDAVLVQRGWVPRDAAERSRLPAVPTPAGAVEIEGLIAPPPARLYAFGADAPGAIRQNLALEDFSRETGLALRPLSVQQLDTAGGAADGLQRQWSAPAVDVHKHYGYAFQWFALAALITILYVWFQLIRPRLRRPA